VDGLTESHHYFKHNSLIIVLNSNLEAFLKMDIITVVFLRMVL